MAKNEALGLPKEAGKQTLDTPSKKEIERRLRVEAGRKMRESISKKKKRRSGVTETSDLQFDDIPKAAFKVPAVLTKMLLTKGLMKGAVIPIGLTFIKKSGTTLVDRAGKKLSDDVIIGLASTPSAVKRIATKMNRPYSVVAKMVADRTDSLIATNRTAFTGRMKSLFERVTGGVSRGGGSKAPLLAEGGELEVLAPNADEIEKVIEKIISRAKSGDEESLLLVTKFGSQSGPSSREVADIIAKELPSIRAVKPKSKVVNLAEAGIQRGAKALPEKELSGYIASDTISRMQTAFRKYTRIEEQLKKAIDGGANKKLIARLRDQLDEANAEAVPYYDEVQEVIGNMVEDFKLTPGGKSMSDNALKRKAIQILKNNFKLPEDIF